MAFGLPREIPIESGWPGGPIYSPDDKKKKAKWLSPPVVIDPSAGLEQVAASQQMPQVAPVFEAGTDTPSFPVRMPELPSVDSVDTPTLSPPVYSPTSYPHLQHGNPLVRTEGMSEPEIAAAKLHALKTSAAGSKITDTPEGLEIGLPHKLSRKGGMWEGFKQGAREGSGNGLGGMLGGGLARMILGGVSPETVQKYKRKQEIAKAQSDLNQSYQNAKEQAQIGDINAQATERTNAPVYRQQAQEEQQRDNLINVWRQINASGEEFSPDNPDHARVHDEAAKLGIALSYGAKPPKYQAPDVMSVTPGSVVIDKKTGKPIYTAPAKPTKEPSLTPYQDYEIQANREKRRAERESAQGELSSLYTAEIAAGQEKDRAAGEVGRIEALLRAKPKDAALKEQLQTARQRYNNAQSFYQGFGAKKTEAQKRVDANRDLPEYQPKKLSDVEQKIYDAAKGKNLDGDEAVKRYRAGKY